MLSNRLKSLVKYFDKDDTVLDVGCDHGYLSIYLVQNKLVSKAIISDISKNAIENAKENLKKFKLDKMIDARCGDGLKVLDDKDGVNTLIITGMGASTILDILDSSKLKNIDKLVIGSNNDHDMLRKEIISKGFYVLDEEFMKVDGIYYINIVFKKGIKKYKADEIKYGPILIKNKEYLNFEIKKLEKILNVIPSSKIKYKLALKREYNKAKRLLEKC